MDVEPALIDADADRVTQVVTNLLTNALKFTPPGGRATVAVRTTTDPSGARRARLTVRDTGPGIPAEELPHVFQRFYRGADAERGSGTGIGLAVVAELVAAHGGAVHADSPPGGGALFTVTLPAL